MINTDKTVYRQENTENKHKWINAKAFKLQGVYGGNLTYMEKYFQVGKIAKLFFVKPAGFAFRYELYATINAQSCHVAFYWSYIHPAGYCSIRNKGIICLTKTVSVYRYLSKPLPN